MFWLVLRFANLCKHFGRCRYKSQSQRRRRVPRCHPFDIFRPFLPFLFDLLHVTQEADWAAFERCLTQNHYGCDSHFILISEQLTTLNTSRCCLAAGTVHFKSHSGKIRAFAEILNSYRQWPCAVLRDLQLLHQPLPPRQRRQESGIICAAGSPKQTAHYGSTVVFQF